MHIMYSKREKKPNRMDQCSTVVSRVYIYTQTPNILQFLKIVFFSVHFHLFK